MSIGGIFISYSHCILNLCITQPVQKVRREREAFGVEVSPLINKQSSHGLQHLSAEVKVHFRKLAI